jgi:hypothetical protein
VRVAGRCRADGRRCVRMARQRPGQHRLHVGLSDRSI